MSEPSESSHSEAREPVQTSRYNPDDEYSDLGVWPPWWKKLWWDLSRRPPDRTDGLRAPVPRTPYWLDEAGAGAAETLSAAQATRAHAESRVERAEARAMRLLQTSLALLALTFTATGFLLDRMIASPQPWSKYLLLLPGAAALGALVVAAALALGVDRVGLSIAPLPGPIAEATDEGRAATAAAEEVRSALISAWTAGHKLSEANRSRAWLTSGIAALLLLGGSVLVGLWAIDEPVEDDYGGYTRTRCAPVGAESEAEDGTGQ